MGQTTVQAEGTAMRNVIPIHERSRIEEEATAWVVRVDGGELSGEEKGHLRAWLAGSPRHAAAFERIAKVWSQMDCLELLAELVPLHQEQPQPRSPRSGWLRPPQLASAFGLVVVLLGGLLIALQPDALSWLGRNHAVAEKVYQTRTGEQSRVELADGSTLTLNTRSEVRVRIDARQRSVYLNTGEAYFEVAPNPRVPFVVYAGNGAVRAIGTGFNVRIVDQAVEVTVIEGTVSVSTAHPERSHPDALTLRARGATRYARRVENPRYLPDAQIDQRVAWKGGKWAFDGQTLGEVIKEIERYTNQRLEIVDPRIAQIRIGGYFDVGAIEPFLDALDTGFGIKHRRIAEDLIVLSSAPVPASEGR